MNPLDLATAYVQALGCDPATTLLDLRALHDTDKALPGHAQRGTLQALWGWIEAYNQQGYGIFVTPAALDGLGRSLENVTTIRAHYVDLDNLSAQQNYEAAGRHAPAPGFAVLSSPGKFHVYWPVQHYTVDLERFSGLQRRLRQVYDGDRAVIDAARVMRLPGTFNMKRPETPHLVTCHALPGFGQTITVEQLEASVSHVTVVDGGVGERHSLGDPALAAPSLAWIKRALDLVDPNDLDRGEWIAVTAAVKQSGWTLTDEASLYQMWAEWCARYGANNQGENEKQWKSLRSTELGWPSLLRRVPSLRAVMSFGEGVAAGAPMLPPGAAGATPPMPAGQTEPPALDCRGEILTHLECAEWFKGCVFVGSMGKMLLPNGRLYDSTKFNGSQYSGKKFIITQDGKMTDEPWKAATRSTLWTVPKVDHLRFLPMQEPGAVVTDVLGRIGVNTYVKPNIDMVPGDIAPFLNHLSAIIPDEGDMRILLDWMAHVVKFPGFKIPWAPVIQSTEGIGKGIIKLAMTYAIGSPYVHFPDAQQLGDSGGKFNGWMRSKVFILADEIKVDEKRHLVEVLKPLISEELIEVQSKGVDQEMEDNPANWGFFTNYKDAVPVTKNGRRYAMFYSPIQTEDDLFARGMGDEYMKALFAWLKGDGQRFIAHWLYNYPIERGAISMRAPRTTSWDEAVSISRSPIERAIQEAIEGAVCGFRAGWVSEIAAMKLIKDNQVVRGNLPPHAIRAVLEAMGYREVGRQPVPYFQEDMTRAGVLYSNRSADVARYGMEQGYE
jgi:hypothetical protein